MSSKYFINKAKQNKSESPSDLLLLSFMSGIMGIFFVYLMPEYVSWITGLFVFFHLVIYIYCIRFDFCVWKVTNYKGWW